MDTSNIIVAFGSTRGGAQKIAKQIAASLGIEAIPLNRLREDALVSAKLAVFVISTIGNGQYPANAESFCANFEYSQLDLSHLYVAELALGSSYYEFFCRAGDGLYQMLNERNVQWLIPYMKSDKASPDYGEGAIATFIKEFGSAVAKASSDAVQIEFTATAWTEQDLPPNGFTHVPVLSRELLSKNGYQEAMHRYKLGLPEGSSYKACDHVILMPENDPSVVTAVISSLHLNASLALAVNDPSGTTLIPANVTVSQLFTKYVDLNCKVPRKLLDFTGVKSTTARTVGEFLISLGAHMTDLPALLNSLPFIEPRTYSIASEKPDCVELIVGDKWIDAIPGLTTRYLRDESVHRVAIQLTEGLFACPPPGTPVLLVALGSGIAPIFSILEHMKKSSAKSNCMLFFGARYNDAVCGVVRDLEAYRKAGVISSMHVCISREGDKQHVDAAIRANSESVWNLWQEKSAQLFYCGLPSGYDAVKEAVVSVTMSAGKQTRSNACYWFAKHQANVESF